jgi:hypothetical protein
MQMLGGNAICLDTLQAAVGYNLPLASVRFRLV